MPVRSAVGQAGTDGTSQVSAVSKMTEIKILFHHSYPEGRVKGLQAQVPAEGEVPQTARNGFYEANDIALLYIPPLMLYLLHVCAATGL